VNVPWPGGSKADPAGLGFRLEERGAAAGVADPFAGMGVAAATHTDGGLSLFVTNSRNEPSAAFRAHGTSTFTNARPDFDAALGTAFAGWGTSWVDLANTGTPDLVLTAGAIPVTNLRADAQPVRVLAPAGGLESAARVFGNAKGILGPAGLRLNGRGLAAADAGNDGRMVVAINTIGGKLVLLRPSGLSGHWLDVRLSRFSPGAVVTVALPGGRRLTRTIQAGSSYLSSEDPRVHFGLGAARKVTQLTVRYPWGAESRLTDVRPNRIVTVAVPVQPVAAPRPVTSARLAGCTPRPHTGSLATLWNATATAVLSVGGASEPVQARDLYDLSLAIDHAVSTHTSNPDTTVTYAAYRLLVWRASFDTSLAQTFALLTRQLTSLCARPEYTNMVGSSPAAVGNRIAAAVIARGRTDGSNEELHYADPTYTAPNAPLIVSQSGSTVHDATFWQPLALSQVSPRGSGPVPAQVQAFADSQWGRAATFALPAKGLATGAPPFGIPSSASYKSAVIAVIRATSGAATAPVDSSPDAWNARARTAAPGTLTGDARLYLKLNGALNDAAVAAYRAKRTYQAPRPISMIRYLAFSGQSSDPHAAAYSTDGLPLVPGLTRLQGNAVEVRFHGSWVAGALWTPSAATPP
ncbi:MAG: ASPIC/UnbV domain-containing protein, partial [Mycobacteriales bacterium]